MKGCVTGHFQKVPLLLRSRSHVQLRKKRVVASKCHSTFSGEYVSLWTFGGENTANVQSETYSVLAPARFYFLQGDGLKYVECQILGLLNH